MAAVTSGRSVGRARHRATRRRTRRRLIVLGLGVLVVAAWAAFAARSLLRAEDELEAGRTQVRAAQRLPPSDLLDGTGDDELARATARFESAAERLDHPVIAPLRVLPWFGRQLDSITSMVDAAGRATTLGTIALDRINETVGDGVPSGPERPAGLRQVGAAAEELNAGLAELDLGPDEALVGRLHHARTEFAADLARLGDTLASLGDASRGLAQLLEGPHRYLVLAANNAQMQNGQGMFLDYGVLETAGGQFNLSTFNSMLDLPRPAEAAALDPGIAAAWPWMNPNDDWRHLGTSANFAVTASTAQRMWANTAQPPIDGVLAVDAVALRALLVLTGPVTVDGTPLDADSVVRFVLHDQYVEFLGDESTDEAQAARQDRLRAVARAALDALDGAATLDLSGLADLADAARARHLMAWSSVPAHQRAFEAAHIDGSIPADAALLSVVNRGGTKLDWYLDVSADVTVDSRADADRVTVSVNLHNTVEPEGEPRYIVGPYPDTGLVVGQYLGVVTMTLPADAAGVTAEGGPVVVAGEDSGRPLIGVRVLVEPGGEATAVVRFDMPSGTGRLRVMPSGRARPVEWTLGDQTVRDRRAPTLSWA